MNELMNIQLKEKSSNKVLSLCLLALLFACEPIRVKTYPERVYPTRPPPTKSSPAEPSPAKPPKTETGQAKTPQVEPLRGKGYIETVSSWKSYEDLAKWMENEFSFDAERFKKFEGTLPPPRSPEETFQLRSGIYVDVAAFAKATLNRINPSYKAQIVVIFMRPYGYNHYVCSFSKEGRVFIMDYGTPYKALTGIHGPYNSLEDYRKFYELQQPVKRHVESIRPLK